MSAEIGNNPNLCVGIELTVCKKIIDVDTKVEIENQVLFKGFINTETFRNCFFRDPRSDAFYSGPSSPREIPNISMESDMESDMEFE